MINPHELDDLTVYIYLRFMTMYYCNVTWSDMSLLSFNDEPEGLRLGDTGTETWEWSISDMVVMSYIYCYPDLWRNLKAYQYIRAKTPHCKRVRGECIANSHHSGAREYLDLGHGVDTRILHSLITKPALLRPQLSFLIPRLISRPLAYRLFSSPLTVRLGLGPLIDR
jgi:hypothetical protein